MMFSGTLYIAISATVAAQPGVDQAGAAVIAAEPVSVAPPPAPRYVIVDIPAFNRSAGDGPPGATVSEVGGKDSDRNGSAPAGSPEPSKAPAAGIALDEAVIATHDANIRLLRQRIEMLRQDGGTGALGILRDLDVRLKRAEAARGLAVARIASVTAKPRAMMREPDRTIAERTATSQSPDTGLVQAGAIPIANAAARQRIVDDLTVERVSHRRDGAPRVAMGAASPAASADMAGHATMARLAQARQSLATARRALEGKTSAKPPTISAFAVMPSPRPIVEPAGAVTASLPGPQGMTKGEAPRSSGYFDAALFLDLAAAKFGMAIAALLLLVALGPFRQPRLSFER